MARVQPSHTVSVDGHGSQKRFKFRDKNKSWNKNKKKKTASVNKWWVPSCFLHRHSFNFISCLMHICEDFLSGDSFWESDLNYFLSCKSASVLQGGKKTFFHVWNKTNSAEKKYFLKCFIRRFVLTRFHRWKQKEQSHQQRTENNFVGLWKVFSCLLFSVFGELDWRKQAKLNRTEGRLNTRPGLLIQIHLLESFSAPQTLEGGEQ